MMIALFLLLGVASSYAEPRIIESSIRLELPPPPAPRSPARTVYESYVTMPVDHFDPQNTDTYQMRYMFNPEFWGGPGSPIFIMVGGEWNIAPGWLQAGNMYLMAEENSGYQVYTEHRYYGRSLPYEEFTTENLRFLNMDQALADLAHFIRDMKSSPMFADSDVILYGGSYAANMVLWFKQRYPHLVLGTVASSGPILGKVDFTDYLEVVHEAFHSEGGDQCISVIRQGIEDTVAAIQTEAGRQTVQETYRLCEPLKYDSVYDMGYFSGLISVSFSGSVQYALPGSLRQICANFATNVYGVTPMQKIAGFIVDYQGLDDEACWGVEYESLVSFYRQRSNSRAWYYQTCTEYGFYQTAPRSGTVFDPLTWISVDYFVNICKQAFTERFNETFVYNAVERVNAMFGGLQPVVNNTINIHGNIDPWHALGVHDRDLTDTSPTYNVPRASHCFDMGSWRNTDTIQMTNVQQIARRLVKQWLS
ncbi:putative serine protease K12H4.7 [Aricia agestis]|uniref:putative serine protease K12H4.7 n=1 Tax=Aricia agestis TaxID=91739 RepID=UPI001C205C0C|nr:putative serine protease K12H4.7 [Aricia agestis]